MIAAGFHQMLYFYWGRCWGDGCKDYIKDKRGRESQTIYTLQTSRELSHMRQVEEGDIKGFQLSVSDKGGPRIRGKKIIILEFFDAARSNREFR